MEINTEQFKKQLLDEKLLLENELSSLGRKVPGSKNDWETTQSNMDILNSDKNEAADRIEDLEERISTENELEIRFSEINRALSKIEKGTYGICEKGDHPIEPARLKANPGARTCMAHMK
ncbi:MAG: TraR/DksA C4-type zinc finger protein [Patescibacteria group bacterium]